MSIEREFHQRAVRTTVLNTLGYRGRGHLYALGSVNAVEEQRIAELPVDSRFQYRLRNPDNSINYPADYLPANSSRAV